MNAAVLLVASGYFVAGFFRRLILWLYDAALWMFTAALFVILIALDQSGFAGVIEDTYYFVLDLFNRKPPLDYQI